MQTGESEGQETGVGSKAQATPQCSSHPASSIQSRPILVLCLHCSLILFPPPLSLPHPAHPFSPLLSMWYIDTDTIVSFPKSHMDFRIHSQPSAQDSVKQASTVQSAFLFPASHKGLVSRAAGPNLFPKDTAHFPHICL